MKVQRSIEITAPPEKIWPFLVEPEKILRWFDLLMRFEYTGARRGGRGATFSYEKESGRRHVKLNYVIDEWVENKKLAFSVTSGSLRKDDQVWSIEPSSSGSRFTMSEDVELPMGIMGKILGVLFIRRMMGKNMEKILANLNREIQWRTEVAQR